MRIITPTQLDTKLNSGEALILLDVCEPDEFENNSLAGAVNIPDSILSVESVKRVLGDVDKYNQVIVYSLNGQRSKKAAQKLTAMGFHRVFSLEGGVANWYAQGYD